MITLSLKEARHVAVAALGFGVSADNSPAETFQALRHLSYVQIDTISVVDRAHHHTLRSRQSAYSPANLHTLQTDRKTIFEYWAHAMAYLPMEDYRYYLPIMDKFRKPVDDRYANRYKLCKPLLKPTLDRIRVEGPMSSKDFERPVNTSPNDGWWNHKPAKIALEWLFWRGDLMVKERRGFQRVFDLTERVLPAEVDTTPPAEKERAIWQINKALTVLGVAEEKSILQYLAVARSSIVRAVLKSGINEGRWCPVRVKSKEDHTYYGLPGIIEKLLPQKLPTTHAAMLLSPFDNFLINRDRVELLFDFQYRIECYVPAPKRQYGYFSLPILFGEKLIGRADTKAHRKEKVFEVKNLVLEPEIRITQKLISALSAGIRQFATNHHCPDIQLKRVEPGPFEVALSKNLR